MTLTASSEFVSFLDYQKYLKYDHHLDNRHDALIINIGTKRKNIEACFFAQFAQDGYDWVDCPER